MRPNHKLLAYFLAMLLPTLLVAGVLAHLLHREGDRLNQARRSAAIEQARGIGEQLMATIGAIERDMRQQLARLPQDNLVGALRQWEQNDPLVRNVFVIDSDDIIVLPVAGETATAEETGFLRRFEALFSGATAWEAAAGADPLPATTGTPPQAPLMSANLRVRREAAAPAADATPLSVTSTGWLPWFAGRDLHLLVWARRYDGLRYGVELEMARVLSGLVTTFAASRPPPGRTIFLLDGNNAVMHSVGALLLEKEPSQPLAEIPLAPMLPHWRIAVMDSLAASQERNMLVFAATAVCLILMVAIMTSGWLLLRDARRHQRDALTKTTFVANVSHELKTPLTSIRMYAELLQEGRATSETKRQQYLSVIVQETRRLTRLIGNVLDFSRIEQGRKTYHAEMVDLAAAAANVVAALHERLAAANIEVSIDMPENYAVWCDRDALEQVFLNLMDNAIKYAASGKHLKITASVCGAHIEMRLCDNGPGIPPHLFKHLFQPFHRADDSLTATQPGCGLGLNISRRLLRDMGGDLRHEPSPGGGACFIITLPTSGASDETA